MIELQYKHLNNQKFIQTLVHLSNAPLKGEGMVKEIYNVSRIVDKVQQESKRAYEVWQKVVTTLEMVEVDKDGVKVKEPKDKEAFVKAELEFMDIKFKIERNKIPATVLEQVSISAQDLLAIEPIIEGLEQFN